MQNEKGTFFSPSNEKRLLELETREKALTPPMEKELATLLAKKEDSRLVKLSDSCKNYLRSLYNIQKYGNRYSFLGGEGVPQMVRGIKQEDWAVKILSEFRNENYFRYKKRIKSDFLIGSIDVIDAKNIESSKKIIEIKTKETVNDFMKRIGMPLEESHWLQIQGYLAITGKDYGEVVYCLVPVQEDKIQEQKDIFYLTYKDKYGENIDKKWVEAENNIRFNDIPISERVISYKVERDEKTIESIHERVEVCRKWIKDFEKTHIDWLNSINK